MAAVTLVTGNRPAAEDAVQNALAEAWVRTQRGKPIDNLTAWVWRAASNRAVSGVRRILAERRASNRLEERDRTHRPASTEAETVDIDRAVRRLPLRQRQVVVLKYFLSMRVDEMASVLGISEGSVKTSLHRGRGALARMLGEAVEEDEEHVELG